MVCDCGGKPALYPYLHYYYTPKKTKNQQIFQKKMRQILSESTSKKISNKNSRKQNTNSTIWYDPEEWTFRENARRKKANEKSGSHPALAVGRQGRKIANLGLTTERKRGHHTNIELSRNPNPKDNRKSYIRDDLQFDDKKYLTIILTNFRQLPPKDQKLVMEIINKKRQQ